MARLSNSLRNLTFSFIGYFLKVLVQFISRTVFIQVLGREYLGLSGLFSNILMMLSLAELGFGEAITFSLYAPLARDDEDAIRGLMQLFRRVYTVVGLFVLIAGLSLTPFLQYFVRNLPHIPGIRWIYVLFVLNSALSYLNTYKRTLIIADQKQYIVSSYSYGCAIAMNIIQTIVLLISGNYFLFLIVMIAFTLIENFLLTQKANSLYPFLKNQHKETFSKEMTSPIIKNIRAMLFHKVGHILVNGTDNILMARIVDLGSVGIYSNYLMITSALETAVKIMFGAITASIGNVGATEPNHIKKKIFNRVNFLSMWLFGFSSICLFCLLTPFITVWIGSEYCFPFVVEFAICLKFFIYGMRQPVIVTKNAFGLYWQDRYKAIAEAAINLIASILLGVHFGVFGILMGTIISSLTTNLWVEPLVLYREGLHAPVSGYFRDYGKFTLVTFVAGGITYKLCELVSLGGVLGLLAKMLICTIVPNLIFTLCFFRRDEFSYFCQLLKTFLIRVKNKLKN